VFVSTKCGVRKSLIHGFQNTKRIAQLCVLSQLWLASLRLCIDIEVLTSSRPGAESQRKPQVRHDQSRAADSPLESFMRYTTAFNGRTRQTPNKSRVLASANCHWFPGKRLPVVMAIRLGSKIGQLRVDGKAATHGTPNLNWPFRSCPPMNAKSCCAVPSKNLGRLLGVFSHFRDSNRYAARED
jgi:hypothetical protein